METQKEKVYMKEFKKFVNMMDSETFAQYRRTRRAKEEYMEEKRE